MPFVWIVEGRHCSRERELSGGVVCKGAELKVDARGMVEAEGASE